MVTLKRAKVISLALLLKPHTMNSKAKRIMLEARPL